jgi:casein kinase I homolog HRR25
MIVGNKYKMEEIIGQGSFGLVYRGLNIRTKDLVAIKVELKNSDYNLLKREAQLCNIFVGQEGFLQLKWFGSDDKFTYMVTNLLVMPLLKFNRNEAKISERLIICKQMVDRIKVLHSKGLVHRDLKPDNFMFSDDHVVYLIDLGFTKSYLIDGKHIPYKELNGIIGTPNYMSVNVHRGINPTRRDDVESLVYIMFKMFHQVLPWEHVDGVDEVCKIKLTIQLPIMFKDIMDYIRSLEYDETPNYEKIKLFLSRY